MEGSSRTALETKPGLPSLLPGMETEHLRDVEEGWRQGIEQGPPKWEELMVQGQE